MTSLLSGYFNYCIGGQTLAEPLYFDVRVGEWRRVVVVRNKVRYERIRGLILFCLWYNTALDPCSYTGVLVAVLFYVFDALVPLIYCVYVPLAYRQM